MIRLSYLKVTFDILGYSNVFIVIFNIWVMVFVKRGVFIFMFVLLLAFATASDVEENLHLNIQTTNSTGGIETGTYEFTFNI